MTSVVLQIIAWVSLIAGVLDALRLWRLELPEFAVAFAVSGAAIWALLLGFASVVVNIRRIAEHIVPQAEVNDTSRSEWVKVGGYWLKRGGIDAPAQSPAIAPEEPPHRS